MLGLPEDVRLPEWCNYVDLSLRQSMQIRANTVLKESLEKKQEREKIMDLIKDILPPSANGHPIHRINMIRQDLSIHWAEWIRRQELKKPKVPELRYHKWVMTSDSRLQGLRADTKMFERVERERAKRYRRYLRSVEKSK